MKHVFLVLGAVAAAPVLAAEPALPLPAPRDASGWGGFHAGMQVGRTDTLLTYRGQSVPGADTRTLGGHAGFSADLGAHVLGVEADVTRFLGTSGDLARLKGRAGMDLGRFQPYLLLGVARLSGDGLLETAPVVGLGGDWKATDRLSIGVEYTRQEFQDAATDRLGVPDADLRIELVHLRLSWRF